MSAVPRLLLIYLFIGVALFRKVNLGITMLTAAIGLGLMSGFRLGAITRGVVRSVFVLDSLRLAAALVLVMVLERIRRHAGFLGGMTDALSEARAGSVRGRGCSAPARGVLDVTGSGAVFHPYGWQDHPQNAYLARRKELHKLLVQASNALSAVNIGSCRFLG